MTQHLETDLNLTADHNLETAIIGGGCFWCIEAPLKRINGVESLVSGYMGGNIDNPSYQQICSGTTGHAEVVKIRFDPKQISFVDILSVFFTVHDPTTLNQQAYDKGTQYRSAIFYLDRQQKQLAENFIRHLTEQKIWVNDIVTTLEPLQTFYPAEEHHQDYYDKNTTQPYCQIIIAPKLEKLEEVFPEKLRQ